MHLGVVLDGAFLRKAMVWLLFLLAALSYEAQLLKAETLETESSGWIVMSPTQDHASLEGSSASSSYCHPGFDCMLVDLCAVVSWSIAGTRFTCGNSLNRQIRFTEIALTFDPPPPRI